MAHREAEPQPNRARRLEGVPAGQRGLEQHAEGEDVALESRGGPVHSLWGQVPHGLDVGGQRKQLDRTVPSQSNRGRRQRPMHAVAPYERRGELPRQTCRHRRRERAFGVEQAGQSGGGGGLHGASTSGTGERFDRGSTRS